MGVATNVVVQTDDFDLQLAYERLRRNHGADVGAVAAFVGLVRDRNPHGVEGEVSTLTLEHYPGMTEKSIEAIVAKAGERWPLLGVEVIHRVGTLEPQAQIVLVVVASGHRDAAFAGAEFIMDYLKTDAVLWKHEATQAGSTWVQSTDQDRQRAQDWDRS